MGIIELKTPQRQPFLTKDFGVTGVMGVMGVMDSEPTAPITLKKCDTPFGLWVQRPETRF